MSRTIAGLLIFFIILSGIGIYGTITYYGRYNDSQRIVSIYIDQCERLSRGFEDARQLIVELAKRNKSITESARKGLELIKGKFGIKN